MTTDLRFVFDTNTIISAVLLKKSINDQRLPRCHRNFITRWRKG